MLATKIFIAFSDVKELAFTPTNEFLMVDNETAIYSIYLPDFVTIKYDLAQFLNEDERSKAERFHLEKDRSRFIITRSILKIILAGYADLEVNEISFDYYSNKKPFLASRPSLCFNVSHSEDYAVIALSTSNVGIDIEYLTENFNFSSLLPEIFSKNERFDIQHAANKKHAFYTAWTRKESFVKGMGIGINEDFKNVPCADGTHTIDPNLFKTNKNWEIASFELSPNYLCAVAAEKNSIDTTNILLYSMPNTLELILKFII